MHKTDIRDQPAYTVAEAARYLKVAPATLRSWVIGRAYPRADGFAQFRPLIRPATKQPPALSFWNLIESHVLRSLRTDHSVSMDALRKAVTPTLEQTVIFKIEWIRSNGAAAFMWGVPKRPDGGKVDYRKTIYASALNEGAFDDNVNALFRKKKGKWTVDKWQIGATDVPWDGLWAREKLPRALFPGPGR